jgi:hypothetical protein
MDECLQDLDNDEEPSSVEDFTLNRGVVGKGDVDFMAPGTQEDLFCQIFAGWEKRSWYRF